MSPSTRHMAWLAVFIGMVCSAPLEEERIYFPGENPDEASKSQREIEHLQPNVMQQSDQSAQQDSRHIMTWLQDGKKENSEDAVVRQLDAEHSPLPANGENYEGARNRQIEGNLQHQLPGWGLNPQTSYTRPRGSLNHPSSESHGDTSYLPSGFLHQGETSTGMLQGAQKVTKHSWASSHLSTSGAGQSGHDSMQVLHLEHPEERFHQGELQHSVTSSAHNTHSQELSSILDRPAHHQIHSNIRQAFGHIMKGFEGTSQESLQPLHHTEHKISHIKKTKVQNVGRQPNHIQSTANNDDINLTQLIEQLQMLEQSPKHVNITWCEEKIKEFLRALRWKQASGVFINQEVQEQTLHQILTHDAVGSTQQREDVDEPLITKVTARPLGVYNFPHSQHMSGVMMQEQGSHSGGVNESQEGFLSYSQPEILTIIPNSESNSPEIMSHHQESPQNVPVPPFTSDNSDLSDLELELPEYIPFEHPHSGDVTVLENHVNRDKNLLLQPAHIETDTPKISTEGERQDSFPAKIQENTGQFPDLAHQTEPNHQETISENYETSGENTKPGSEPEMSLQSAGTGYQNTNEQVGATVPKSYTEKKPISDVIPLNEIPEDDGKLRSQEYNENFEGSDHAVHGRPQAPQDGTGDTIENNERKSSQVRPLGQFSEGILETREEQNIAPNVSQEHHLYSAGSSSVSVQTLHKQQINYENLIEELIQLESIPGHQAIDKCEEKIQEFLEILKFQQEQGFGQTQLELEKLHQTLIQQAQERGEQLAKTDSEAPTLPQPSFWRRVQKKIKNTYESAKDQAKEVLG